MGFMKHIGSTEELIGPHAGVSEEVKQRKTVKSEANLGKNEADLSHGRERKVVLRVTLNTSYEGRVDGGPQADDDSRRCGDWCLPQERRRPEQQVRPGVDRKSSVKEGARRGRPFHGSRKPTAC